METDSTDLPLTVALRVANRRASRLAARHLEPLGLDELLAGILLLAGASGGCTQRELIDGTGSDKSSMVRAVDTLEERGLARRTPHPVDRRARWIQVTDEGAALLDRLGAARTAVEEQLLAPLPPEERQRFRHLLAGFAGPPPPAAGPRLSRRRAPGRAGAAPRNAPPDG
jgi:DNA-binding MarR family transcriptional regulator